MRSLRGFSAKTIHETAHAIGRMANLRLRTQVVALLFFSLWTAGCSHHHRLQAAAPPPPPTPQAVPSPSPQASNRTTSPRRSRPAPGKILYSEVGIASWYGAPYHNARTANGAIYNENGMTAAHRTLPMGTIVRVTNLATHQSAVLTINDRGPFVPNRILDLSRGAAIKLGVFRTGTARVRIDVLRSPHSASPDGRWCVQVGAFRRAASADRLRDQLRQRFPRASVIAFAGATGHWVRIRPAGESRRSATEVASSLHLREGQAYLVRLN